MSLVWVHEDAITLDHPVMTAAGQNAQPVFIWDSKHHDAQAYSLKRRVFIFECVVDLGIPIYVGTPADILKDLAGDQAIYTAVSPDPYIQDVIAELKQTQDIVTVENRAFAAISEDADTRRFFRYWNQAKKTALLPTVELDEPVIKPLDIV